MRYLVVILLMGLAIFAFYYIYVLSKHLYNNLMSSYHKRNINNIEKELIQISVNQNSNNKNSTKGNDEIADEVIANFQKSKGSQKEVQGKFYWDDVEQYLKK